jgi:hypothetical protein
MYRLDADIPKLNPHVGHKVEVSGTLDAASATTIGSAGSGIGLRMRRGSEQREAPV